jgi:hypothetical protein
MTTLYLINSNNPGYSTPIELYSPESKPLGKSYEDHIKDWWRWLISIPANMSPIDDLTGERCFVGQSNSSTLLYIVGSGGGHVERKCTVPEGISIMLAPSAAEMSDKEGKDVTIEDMHRLSKADQDSATFQVTLDGKTYSMEDLAQYRKHTEPFNVVFPDKGIFGVGIGGNSTIVADGYYLITKNLTKGVHEIKHESDIDCPMGDCDANFSETITYTLNVE